MSKTKAPVMLEHKVTRTTIVATLIGIALAALNGLQAHSELLGSLPAAWQSIILTTAIPAAVLFIGYLTPHTERADLEPAAQAPDGAYDVTTLELAPAARHAAPVGVDETLGEH